ncbi:MAG: hypothetical protein ACREMO_09545 [Gemmatimonadales bacterium]
MRMRKWLTSYLSCVEADTRLPAPLNLALPPARRGKGGLAGSLLFHLLLFVLLVPLVDHDLGRPLPVANRSPGGEGSGGGDGGRIAGYISLPVIRPPAGVATPAAAPPVISPDVVRTSPSLPAPGLPAETTTVASIPTGSEPGAGGVAEGGAGAGPGEGGRTGGGFGPGAGSGVGAGGQGARGQAPEARQIILPPEDRPKALRGQSVRVTFLVGADGTVLRVDIDPEIQDRGYAKRFIEVMQKYQFRPARAPDGTPITGTTTITVTL